MRGILRLRLAHQGYAFSRGGAGLALAAILLSGWATSAMAQGNPKTRPGDPKVRRTALSREEEKQWLDDLSSARMETSRSRVDMNDRNSRRRPSSDDLDTPTSELKRIRPLLSEFAQESSLLKSQLSEDLTQNPSLRSLLSPAYDVAAQAVVLSQRAEDETDHHVLLDDLQDVDAAWGGLAYRLSGTRKLSREAQDHVKNMNDIAGEVRQAIDIGQQVNHRELSSKAVSLATDLENLIDDITIELGKTPEARRLAADTNKAHQQVLAIADLADGRSDMKTIVDEYKRFQELWYPQAASLQAKDRDYLERSLRRIAKDDGEMSRLLMMEQRFDKTQVVYLTNALRSDIDEFMSTPIKHLLKLPKSSQALATADEFYGVCDNFIDTVNQQDDYDHIVDAFRHIEQADREFLRAFNAVDDEDTATALEKISQTLNALRVAIQVDREDFNRPTASSLAAKIENLADGIDITARRWLAHDRQSFGQDCLEETESLVREAAKLHDAIVNGANVATIRQDTEALYQNWRRVYNYLVKCQSDERPALGRFASQLTPAMVELRTLVAQ